MDYHNIEYTTDVVAACIVLHNICELNNDTSNLEWIHIDESSHDTTSPAADVSRRTTESATRIRDTLKDYLYAHQ